MHTPQTSFSHQKVVSLTKAILVTIGIGTIVAMALMAPNSLQILKPFLGRGTRKDHERKRIRQAIQSLRAQGMVERVKKNGAMYLRTTEKRSRMSE
ncbi:MAG: hypothetical protein WAP52_03495, partial [Candidatus Sungiibacteriota bacterium]